MTTSSYRNPGSQTIFLLLVVFLVLLTSCDKDTPEPVQTEPLYYVEYEQQFNRSAEQISTLAQFAGLGELIDYLRYDITLYSITYRTTFLGQEITASGLVTFPETSDPVPLMSFQHGTISRNSEAPTEDITTYGLLSGIAGAGFIFLVPDFIGFGSSKEIVHPYYHVPSTARSITDMLLASRELADDLGYHFSGEVFLAGYSEGGFATMAAHKYMEDNPMNGFELIASAPASGGYDLKGMQEYFFMLETYNEPYYLAYVALSYSNVYGWDNVLDDMFNEPYATRIPDLFNGTLSGGQINDLLTDSIKGLIQPDILINIDTDPEYAYILNAFEENSLDNWVPFQRMFLYHGTDDITVPYQNSIDTYKNMIRLGADESTLTFIPLEGETHGSGALPYISDILKKFYSLK
jgi:pimeloyl-ACP methyl ester carboxylesterase